jgi:hypothetical protein
MEKTPLSIVRRRPRLSPTDCGDAYALMQDRFQSPRARKRALALILIDQGARPDVIFRRTGVGLKSQRELLHRLSAHGFQAAIFGSPRRLDQRHYDVRAIIDVLRDCFKSPPPDGTPAWNLVRLTTVVREKVMGAQGISKETIRLMLKKDLGISSICDVRSTWVAHNRLSHPVLPRLTDSVAHYRRDDRTGRMVMHF